MFVDIKWAAARRDYISKILQVIFETLLAHSQVVLWKHWSNCIIASIICYWMTTINEPCISASIDAELTHSGHSTHCMCMCVCACLRVFSALWCVSMWSAAQHDTVWMQAWWLFYDYSPACVCIFVSICLLSAFPLGSCDSRGGRLRGVSLVRRITYIC